MSVDQGPSKIADIRARMGVDKNYANTYRARLLEQELIADAGYSKVIFATPGLAEYIREHVAVEGLNL